MLDQIVIKLLRYHFLFVPQIPYRPFGLRV